MFATDSSGRTALHLASDCVVGVGVGLGGKGEDEGADLGLHEGVTRGRSEPELEEDNEASDTAPDALAQIREKGKKRNTEITFDPYSYRMLLYASVACERLLLAGAVVYTTDNEGPSQSS